MTATTMARPTGTVAPPQPSPRPYRLSKIITPDGVSVKIMSSNGDEMAILRSAGGRKEANGEFMVEAMNQPRLDMLTFHNALRVMDSIDQNELVEAGLIEAGDKAEWNSFSAHPYYWFIRCDDEKAAKLWTLITARMAGRP